MSKRISANMFVKNDDGNIVMVPNVEVRRKDLMGMLNNPQAVLPEYAAGAGDVESVNFWFKPGSNDLKEVLVRFNGAITEEKTNLVNAVFGGNPAEKVLKIRTFRPYRPLNQYQIQVQKLLDSLIVVESLPTRAEIVEEIRGLLVEFGMEPVTAFANSDLYPETTKETVKTESVEISGEISVDQAEEVENNAATADALEDIASEKKNIAVEYAEAKGRSI